MSYSLPALVGDLRATYSTTAQREAIGLMLMARNRGLRRERDVFTSAAIMLCRRDS